MSEKNDTNANQEEPPQDERAVRIGRWVDHDLDASDRAVFEAEMAADPDLRRAVEAAARVGDVLRAHLAPGDEVPNPEAFNRSVLAAIGASAGSSARDAGGTASGPDPDYEVVVPGPASWFRLPWVVAAAACAVALLSVITRNGKSGGAPSAGVVYAPDPHVQADIFYDSEAGATVVVLEGLEELPAEREVMPYRVAGYERASDSGRIVFFSEENPDIPLYVLLPHGDGGRSIHAVR